MPSAAPGPSVTPRRALAALFAALGAALFAWLLSRVDLAAVAAEIVALGAAGFALVLAIYLLEFAFDSAAWQLTLAGVPASPRWTARLFLVRLAGEAYNVITPLGGMGGEPVKAVILRRRHLVPYYRSGASLVLAKTMNALALVLFLAGGFALMLGDGRISTEIRVVAGSGLTALTLGIGGFLALQHARLTSRLGRRLKLGRAIAALAEFDQHLVSFYTSDPRRFLSVLALGLGNWLLGAAGVWATLAFMGHPVGFRDAWIIEAMVQMVRAATFFIPASLGAQEGAIMLVTGAITGSADTGLAVALVRRARELLWVLAGLAASVPLLGGAVPARGEPPA